MQQWLKRWRREAPAPQASGPSVIDPPGFAPLAADDGRTRIVLTWTEEGVKAVWFNFGAPENRAALGALYLKGALTLLMQSADIVEEGIHDRDLEAAAASCPEGTRRADDA